MAWVCYLLECAGRTYVGATAHKERRLRQHNGELAGGARSTRGRVWRRVCTVEGFPDARAALQFEWQWKRTRAAGRTPAERRISGAYTLLARGRSTARSRPFATFPGGGPRLVLED